MEAAQKTPVKRRRRIDTSDVPETSFSGSDAVRGKHHAAFVREACLAQLDPDVRAAFPTDAAVNQALRRALERGP